MPRRAPSSPAIPTETPADRLQDAVAELAQNVRILTEIIDQIREDLSWLTRNGMPHQALSVFVQRMPGLAEEGRRGSLELSFARFPDRDPTADTLSDDQVRAAVIEDVVQRLSRSIGEFAHEQLNILVTIVDHAHRDVLQAIRHPQEVHHEDSTQTKSRRRQTKQKGTAPIAPAAPAEPPPPPGCLF